MEVRYSDPAKRDLVEIWASIARDSEASADRVIRRIFRKTQHLERFPELGAVDMRFGRRNLRSTNVKPYVVYYQIQNNYAEIIRIVHGSRDHRPLLEDDVE
jgi:toxin ParE1/3/4